MRQNQKVAPNTIHKEIAALSAGFNFCAVEELVAYNPTKAIKKPKIKQVRPPYVPTKDELLAIIDHLYVGARRFFLALCNSGCRLGEIQKANVGDVNLDVGILAVTRKGGKSEQIIMNDTMKNPAYKTNWNHGEIPDRMNRFS